MIHNLLRRGYQLLLALFAVALVYSFFYAAIVPPIGKAIWIWPRSSSFRRLSW